MLSPRPCRPARTTGARFLRACPESRPGKERSLRGRGWSALKRRCSMRSGRHSPRAPVTRSRPPPAVVATSTWIFCAEAPDVRLVALDVSWAPRLLGLPTVPQRCRHRMPTCQLQGDSTVRSHVRSSVAIFLDRLPDQEIKRSRAGRARSGTLGAPALICLGEGLPRALPVVGALLPRLPIAPGCPEEVSAVDVDRPGELSQRVLDRVNHVLAQHRDIPTLRAAGRRPRPGPRGRVDKTCCPLDRRTAR